MFNYSSIPGWVIAASLMVWLFAIVGVVVVARTFWAFTRPFRIFDRWKRRNNVGF